MANNNNEGMENVTEGGYDAEFVDEIGDYFKCVICQMVLRDPVLYIECGHRFCSGCFDKIKTFAAQRNIELLCPHDRVHIDVNQVFPDKGISRAIMDLKVRCDNHREGCEWTGELRDLQRHSEVCALQKEKDTSLLLTRLTKRVEQCEERITEKDTKIERLQTWMDEKDTQIQNMQKTLQSCMEQLQMRDKQIDMLLKDRWKTKQEDNCQPECSASEEPFNKMQNLNLNTHLDQELNEKIISHVMNVKEYRPNEYTVFEWKLRDYNKHRNEGGTFYSPKFYSELNGYCCRLSLEWFGSNSKGQLGLFLHILKDVWGDTPNKPFKMAFEFESEDDSGNVNFWKSWSYPYDPAYFTIYGDGDETVGWGAGDFLNMPALGKHIIQDTLTIKCSMYHEERRSVPTQSWAELYRLRLAQKL